MGMFGAGPLRWYPYRWWTVSRLIFHDQSLRMFMIWCCLEACLGSMNCTNEEKSNSQWVVVYQSQLICRLTTSLSSSLLCCIADGMDQSKFRCPKVKGRPSKALEALYRPTLHCSGFWIHGHQLRFSICNEDDPAGVTLSSPVQPPGTSQQIAVGAAPAARQLLPRGEEPVCSSGNDLASDFASIQSHRMWLSQNWS